MHELSIHKSLNSNEEIWGGDGLMYKGIAKYNSPDMDFKATIGEGIFCLRDQDLFAKLTGGDDIFPHLSGIKYDKSAVQSQSFGTRIPR